MNVRLLIPLLVAMTFTNGCVTIAGNALRDLERTSPVEVPRVEQTVGNYSFHLDGGKMITSNKAGRILNDQILERWRKWGYISGHVYKKSSQFSGNADYEITLSGTQDGDSSILLQLVSGLTLCTLPYYVNTHLDVAYDVRDRRAGTTYHAAVRDSFNTVISLLLVPFSPFAQGGRSKTWDRIAANLYEQLRSQGAFAGAPPARASSPITTPVTSEPAPRARQPAAPPPAPAPEHENFLYPPSVNERP